MEFVDTHCHIQSAGLPVGERSTREIWAKDAALTGANLVKNAQEAGVSRMICVGCDLADSELAIAFAKKHSVCRASIGIHPHEAKDYAGNREALEAFSALATDESVVAVGECGLDFYYNHSPMAEQLEILKFQIELALKHDLPMIFHVRDAFDDFWPIFDKYKGIRGVLHSFTDSAENMRMAMDRGLYIGVNGIATFAKNEKQLSMYSEIPLERLLLETDAPFLTPTPYRGKINEPKYVGVVAEFMAGLRNKRLEEISQTTTANARKLFNI
jgi:TatD DNase family protein